MLDDRANTRTPIWGGDRLDLDAYLERVGFRGRVEPGIDTLRELQYAHVTTFPFENLDAFLRRPMSLDLDTLQDKMVRGRRGGYCFEQASLFAAVLERVGFSVTGLLGRVQKGSTAVRPPTHAMLRVETAESAADGRSWLCDAGFGEGQLAPIELADGATAARGGWSYRLTRGAPVPGADGWLFHGLRGGEWFHLHSVTLDPRVPVDYTVANHYVSTHPRSPFSGRLWVQRLGDGLLHQLDGTTLSAFQPDTPVGEMEWTRQIATSVVPEVLAEVFGIVLDEADAAAVVDRLAAQQREAAVSAA
ncbi:arylamine N-acetyltransferase family protein [Allostreptomyces psammosilenae]|uniref:N-hydroxyarylamine O-acetyltransferase n=1 Tax=Allostreptomyces psammosilenae TaxID=1892865 RepID=A0A852ZPZ7_9ACTN|nr:arylamine N-acetyltransferase [Allostreptomyces psammosilenae]NYI03567.1 N-hydroxyarylamine O-acetyltransferase [Allostreptomyces psammosilenae]